MTDLRRDSDLSALAVLTPDRAAILQQRTRDLIREWLSSVDDAAVLRVISLMGRDAIARAADGAARLPTGRSPAAVEADAILAELRATVEALAEPDMPAPRPRFRLFAPPALPPVDTQQTEARLADLLARLDRARDALLRDGIRFAADRTRLAEADAELEQVAHLLTGLVPRLDAAAREIAPDMPARAALLRGEATAALTERTRDVLTQLVVTRQGRLSLDLLVEGQETLAAAIARTSTTMMAALRTALAARTAIADGARMTAQADALRTTASAAADAGDRSAAARRARADAVTQMRRALIADDIRLTPSSLD